MQWLRARTIVQFINEPLKSMCFRHTIFPIRTLFVRCLVDRLYYFFIVRRSFSAFFAFQYNDTVVNLSEQQCKNSMNEITQFRNKKYFRYFRIFFSSFPPNKVSEIVLYS